MKINWFSPLPPAETDIAHYTRRILHALHHIGDVTLWTDQRDYELEIEKYVKVKTFHHDQISWKELNSAELSIYNIGNHPLFHESIWQVSRCHPGLVILHDYRLQHLFGGLYKEKYKDFEGYCTLMKHYYGEKGYQAAKTFWDGKCNTEFMAENYPLTYLALENALGVVVHSLEIFDILAKNNTWPLAYIPLPYPSTQSFKNTQPTKNQKKEINPPYRLIVFGYLGPNRQLDSILVALSDYPKRERFRLDVYGRIWDTEFLIQQIKRLKLEEIVFVHGFVPEEELDLALSNAHLAINLRYPTMGEASGSQLRIWAHSLPSLVTKTGWYASLSEEVVAFVNPESPIKDIQEHLDAFLDDPPRFHKIGENGRRKLELEHQPSTYAQGIIDFIPYVKRFRPEALAYRLAERVGAEMSCWGDLVKNDEHIRKAAEEIYLLTGRKRTSKAL